MVQPLLDVVPAPLPDVRRPGGTGRRLGQRAGYLVGGGRDVTATQGTGRPLAGTRQGLGSGTDCVITGALLLGPRGVTFKDGLCE